MLHEETWIPFDVTYDVTAWSNPLLMNLDGGWSGDADVADVAAWCPTSRRRSGCQRPTTSPRSLLLENDAEHPRLRIGRPDGVLLR